MSTVQITQVTVPDGFIDFGIGQPQLDILPLKILEQAAAHRLSQKDTSILQYGHQQGDGQFRQTLGRFLSGYYGTAVDPNHLFITGGISQALDLICTVLTKPGDTIFIEEPTYFLALRIFEDYHLNIVGIPVDENGLIIEILEEKLAEQQPTFLYTIPTFHNPTAVTLSAARREALVNLSEQHNFTIVADEVYHLLGYTSSPPPPLASFDRTGAVLSLGSFSKILAPGLRLGWMQTTPARLEPFLTYGFMDSGGGLNPFVSALVNSVIELGLQQEYLTFLRRTYQDRILTLSQALHRHLPALSFTIPDGGYFIWAYLPETVDAALLLDKAKAYDVGFQPGIKFSNTQGLQNYLRLSFAYYGEEELVEGVKRLAHVIK